MATVAKQVFRRHAICAAQRERMMKLFQRSLVQIANRKYLPGSDGEGFPNYLKEPGDDFPKVVNWREIATNHQKGDTKANVADMGKAFRPVIDDMLHSHSALLFKNLPIADSEGFSHLLAGLGYNTMPYVGGSAVRDHLKKNVSTASNEPPESSIEPHNEMSYLPRWPKMFMMFCEVAPSPGTGGESVITDVRDVKRALEPEVLQKFERLGVAYLRNMPDKNSGKAWYISWQEGLLTDDREEAERKLAKIADHWTWHEDGTLTSTVIIPPQHPHYRTGELVWFNQIHSMNASFFTTSPQYMKYVEQDIQENEFPFQTTYGDGSPIEPKVLQHIRNVLWSVAVGWQMQKGDLLILDNMYVQHARLSFTGERKLLVSLVPLEEEYYQKRHVYNME